MTAVSGITKSKDSSKSQSTSAKTEQSPSNPSGSIITVLMLVAVLATVGGILFAFFKKRNSDKTKKEVKEDGFSN